MRINKFVAAASGLSRRAADQAIMDRRVSINGQPAELGDDVDSDSEYVVIKLDDHLLELPEQNETIMLNKPVGYVCSREGQGSRTVYDLLPEQYQHLKTVGRLDKASSGLLLLTNDGRLAHELTHPRHAKEKVYTVTLDKPLAPAAASQVEQGIELEDGPSHLQVKAVGPAAYEVRLCEGRNRQIRRTFATLGYTVKKLHRTSFGTYELGDLKSGETKKI